MHKYFSGIDGCPSGWLIVQLDENHAWTIGVMRNIDAIATWVDKSILTLIDIPIGLLDSDGPHRTCDQEARRALGRPRAASVFPAPSRLAVYADSYEEGCRLNYQCLGTRLSKQTWNIVAKIQEVDQLLQKHSFGYRLRESHPEVCFWALNHKMPMRFNKQKPSGQEERLLLLSHYLPQAKDIVNYAAEKYLRKELAIDDILDAIVLAVTAMLGHKKLCTFPSKPPKDKQNIVMEIIYPAVDKR